MHVNAANLLVCLFVCLFVITFLPFSYTVVDTFLPDFSLFQIIDELDKKSNQKHFEGVE